jgi:hypothetical protein
VCHAVRAPGSNVTLEPSAGAGECASNSRSILTVPVKYSAGPLPEICEPTLLIFHCSDLLPKSPQEPSSGSRIKQRLDRAPLVHRTVSLCHLIERQSQVKNPAGVDLPVPHQLNQLGQVTAHRSGTTMEMDVGVEQHLAILARRHAGRRHSSRSRLCEWNGSPASSIAVCRRTPAPSQHRSRW